jgi:N6-L-threonylcarbamoyladenine synthase
LISRALEVAGGVRLGECAAIAATQGPGLATSLMVGFSAAKALAIGLGKPFIAVNHMEGHLLSPFHGVPEGVRPAVGLVVSGGHTMLLAVRGVGDYDLLGQTRDDAAGEAFDKVAKLLGLGYPGGPLIDQLARRGDPSRFDFPRSMLGSGDLNFSFSGLKTAVRYALPKLAAPLPVEDLCASFQDAVVDVLVEKTRRAVRATGINCVAVSGGVSCNSRLREKLRVASGSTQDGFELLLAEPLLCTDNAGMIAHVAMLKARRGLYSELTADVNPNLRL